MIHNMNKKIVDINENWIIKAIKLDMTEQGIKGTDIARKAGNCRSEVSKVLAGKRRNKSIIRAAVESLNW